MKKQNKRNTILLISSFIVLLIVQIINSQSAPNLHQVFLAIMGAGAILLAPLISGDLE